jgi:hypothetical protein
MPAECGAQPGQARRRTEVRWLLPAVTGIRLPLGPRHHGSGHGGLSRAGSRSIFQGSHKWQSSSTRCMWHLRSRWCPTISPQPSIARCGPRPLQRSFTVSGTRTGTPAAQHATAGFAMRLLPGSPPAAQSSCPSAIANIAPRSCEFRHVLLLLVLIRLACWFRELRGAATERPHRRVSCGRRG